MKKLATRAFATMIAAVLAVSCGLALGACSSGPDPEEVIREDLSANLDEIKNLDDEAIDELAEGMGNLGLEDYGVGAEDIVASMIDGFDYSIDSIDVEGDAATASVTVTSKSMSELMDLDYDAMADDLIDAVMSEEIDATDDDAINAWVGEYVMGMIDAIEPSEKDITLTYVNGDDGWELDESSESEAMQIFL